MTESVSNNQPASFVSRFAWLLNADEPPRPNVRVTVENGVVAEISDVPPDEINLIQPLALLPRFVNAHTHLEFSQLCEEVSPANPFPDWIRSVIRYRLNHPEHGFVSKAVQQGASESVNASIALVGEITTSDEGRDALIAATSTSDLAAISFRELIGFRSESVASQLTVAEQCLNMPENLHGKRVALGLSPHAPYSVHPELFEGIVDCAIRHDVVVAMHLAETLDELELLKHRSGRFVDFLSSMNLWDSATLGSINSVLHYLEKLAQNNRALAVHCNYLSDKEIQFLGQHTNVAVVYCPRTHAYFGHSPHPWQRLIAAGANVVLGTDSKASNPDLNIWRELQLIASRSSSPPIWELLSMITTNAAESLGYVPSVCQIKVGSRFTGSVVAVESDTLSGLNASLQSPTAVCQPLGID